MDKKQFNMMANYSMLIIMLLTTITMLLGATITILILMFSKDIFVHFAILMLSLIAIYILMYKFNKTELRKLKNI